jgi:peptidoglycan lytic transglycosylase
MRVRSGEFARLIRRRRGGIKPAPAALRPATCLLPVLLAVVPLAACSQGGPAPDARLGVASSPRVANGRAIPKGGGIYKVGQPYQVAGRWYVPREVDRYDQTGIASWYGTAFHGRRTANGEIYDMNALTAGHPTLPMPSYAYVTNLDNGRTILVRINDRGPYVNDRLIDLSRRSAAELGYTRHGLARVRVRYAGRAPLDGNDRAERRHLAAQSWYQGDLNVAQAAASEITTGAIGQHAPVAALGGPALPHGEQGPFATIAEAERMRHELEGRATILLKDATSGAEPAYFVRPD